MYTLKPFFDPELKRLAWTKGGSTDIHLNTAANPETFRQYFHGNAKGASGQKKLVLGLLEKAGWGWERIRALLPKTADIRRFLVLHEISHLRHNDALVYRKLPQEGQLQIEVRACLEALEQILLEKTPKIKK